MQHGLTQTCRARELGRVHLLERKSFEQRQHVVDVRDRHADLPDFAARERVVGVVAGLGRQIERD